jgi:hypothetical protein
MIDPMSVPVLVTAPTAPVVSLDLVKMHAAIDGTFTDSLLSVHVAAAVAWLDGWNGILGRAIMPQVWRQDFPRSDVYRLAMPDVSVATVSWLDADGLWTGAEPGEIALDVRGVTVTATVPETTRVRVTYTCALPAANLPSVQLAVLMLAAHWNRNREGVGAPMEAQPMTVSEILLPLRRGLV